MPLLAGLSDATAQDVLAPPPPGFSIDTITPFEPLYPETDLSALDVLTTGPELGLEALKWGIANLEPRFLYRVNYSEGLRSNREETSKTLIHELHPGIKVDIGKLWDINYAPVARFYMSDRFRDTFNHSVRLSGGTTYGDWVFGLRQSYVNTEDPSTETASQTQREVFATGLNAGYSFNSKVSLSLSLSQNLRFIGSDNDSDSGNFSNSRNWSTMDWLNYQIFPRIGVGLGAGVTFTDVEFGTDMLSEQVMGRVSWSVQQKLTLSASGGIDIRQYLDSDAAGSMSPLFTVSARYRLFEFTSLTLTGSRSVSASAFRNTVSESTLVRASLSQRLLGKLNLTVAGGIRNSSYSNTLMDLETTREDEGTFYDVRLGTGFFKRATASVFYRHNENESSGGGFGYSSNQMGLEVGYQF